MVFVGGRGLTGALLLRVAGRVGVQGLRPLLAGRVAGLVGVPCLFAVVAELGAAAVPAAHQAGAAGTARGDDGEPDGKTQRLELENTFQKLRANRQVNHT